jgi:tRNA U34 5-methylaminomethyl-2-thiouridine-forming methyltransferase MnmC|tara:strand:- start:770 stop:1450 length:681 start_codon:yes stop_codon:yes gene_type:complete
MTKLEILITGDGSTSFFHPELDETYHSRHGAIQEAVHVFIKTGLEHSIQQNNLKQISIFEMGFGTGLNCLLTDLWSLENSFTINYTGIENTVLSDEQIDSCNYVEILNDKNAAEIFNKIHTSQWNEGATISADFKLTKIESDIEEFKSSKKFDLIYFDAFGPRVQPFLWEITVLKKMYELLNYGGFFVTYCAKGSVRRTLIELGFEVERLPGPPGKREMLRARKVD